MVFRVHLNAGVIEVGESLAIHDQRDIVLHASGHVHYLITEERNCGIMKTRIEVQYYVSAS